MTPSPAKPAKKEKVRRQTPEELQENLRYNRMMYGPTAGEKRPLVKKVDYGAPYLKHPKFQALMEAFKKGTAYEFQVTDKTKSYAVTTDGTDICFGSKVIYYSRSLNKYESHLLLDRAAAMQFQGIDAFVHLVIAVQRSLPELDAPALNFVNSTFFCGSDSFETGIAATGPNLLLGAYRNAKAKEKGKG